MINFNDLNSMQGGAQKFTGKQLVLLDTDASARSVREGAANASLMLASFSDYENDGAPDFMSAFNEADGIVFEKFGVAVINENLTEEISVLTESSKSRKTFIYSEPERFVYAMHDPINLFLEGYKSAIDHVFSHLTGTSTNGLDASSNFVDDAIASWGVHATQVLSSKYSGKGINIAVLDTGFNLEHPDFVGRPVSTRSFISGQEPDDFHGHGSHCIGIASGNVNTSLGRRYGVAKDANIFAGKVLSNTGGGTDSSILAGMEWAVANECKVISMSLGGPVRKDESYSSVFNDLALRALRNGTLIVAAAGNASRRRDRDVQPVSHPANCPAIMAVGALDNLLDVAHFSCGGLNPDGGQVDIAGPGVNIYSSWRTPGNYNTISGTSMATPFVAGIAALYWEAHPEATAAEIWMYLTQNAKRLNINATDVGAGLVRAPQ